MKKRYLLFFVISLVCVLSLSLGTVLPAGAESSAPQQKVYTISALDSLDEFSEGNRQGMVNPEIVTENGRTYFSATTYGDRQVSLLAINFSPIDLSKIDRSKAYLQFSIWVEDNSAISSEGNIELTSSGHSDAEEISWEFNGDRCANSKLVSGQWNEVNIQIGDGASRLGKIKWEKINFFRVFCFTTKQMKIAYDNIRITIVEDMNMPTVFNSVAANSFTTENATLTGGDESSTVVLDAGESVLKTSAYEMSAPLAALGMVNFDFIANDPEKISSARITLVTDTGSAWYDVPVSGQVEFSEKFTDYDGVDGVYANFPNVTEYRIEFTTTERTEITISKACVDTVPNLLIREIDKIGEITIDNYKEKAEQIAGVEQLAVDLRTETGAQETYLTQYAYNYLKFKIEKEKFDYYKACGENGIYMTVYVRDDEYRIGDVVNVVVELRNLSDEYRNDSWSLSYDEWYLEPIGATSGNINLGAGKSRTIEVPFTVRMGGLTWFGSTVSSASQQTLAWEDYLIINDKGLYLGDSHTHSIQSDGINALEDNFYTALTKWKLAFIYATDHNADPGVTTDIDYARKVLEAAGLSEFISIKGTEISGLVANVPGYDYSLAGHLLYYNGSTYYEEPTYMDRESNVYLYQMIMKSIYEEGGYAYIAHPYQGQYRFSVIGEDKTRVDVYPEITGIEVFNGWQYGGSYKQFGWSLEAVEYWDRINITGRKKYYAIGNSDAHNIVDLSNSYTGLLLEDYSELSINNAYGSGKAYASSGVDLLYTLDGLDMGETIFSEEDKNVTLKVSARDKRQIIRKIKLISYEMNYSLEPSDSDAGYATREEVVLYDDQDGSLNQYFVDIEREITVKPGRFYRIEATSNSDEELAKTSGRVFVRYACSNPIWVESRATDFKLSTESVNLKAGEKFVLFIEETDGIYDTVRYTSSAPDIVRVEVNGKITVSDNAPAGTYTVTAKTASGSVAKTVSVVVGESGESGGPSVTPGNPENKKGCGSGVFDTAAMLTLMIFGSAISLLLRKF